MDRLGLMDDTKTPAGRPERPLGCFITALQAKRGLAEALVFDGITYRSCHAELERAAKAASIKCARLGWHTLRNMHNAWFRFNVGAADAKAQLGHTSLAVNDRYLLSDGEDLKRRASAVLRMQAEVMGIENGNVQ